MSSSSNLCSAMKKMLQKVSDDPSQSETKKLLEGAIKDCCGEKACSKCSDFVASMNAFAKRTAGSSSGSAAARKKK